MQEMKVEDAGPEDDIMHNTPQAAEKQGEASASDTEEKPSRKNTKVSESPRTSVSNAQSPAVKSEQEEVVGGEITLKVEPGKAPKLARSTSKKIVTRAPQLFSHLPDSTAEATSTFDILSDCNYAAKYLGYTEPALECDCSEEWGMS